MKTDQAIQRLLDDICRAFPEIRARMARHQDFMTSAKLEEFAQATTEAFAEGELRRGMAYADFVSQRLNPAHLAEYEYLDTYYVEHLFWPEDLAAAHAGWPLLPDNLKALYLGFHGVAPV